MRGNHNLKQRGGHGDCVIWADLEDCYEKECPDLGDQLGMMYVKDQGVQGDSQV